MEVTYLTWTEDQCAPRPPGPWSKVNSRTDLKGLSLLLAPEGSKPWITSEP